MEVPTSSGGADNGRDSCGRLDFMYADTTERSTLLPGLTLSPVSTSVSSAPIRASTLSRKGGTKDEPLLREWLLWLELGEGPGEEQVERELAEPRLGKEKRELDRWPLHWVLQVSGWCRSSHCSFSSGSSQARGSELWGCWWTLRRDVTRWWCRRFLWEVALRVKVDGAEVDPVIVDDMWQGSCWCLKCEPWT